MAFFSQQPYFNPKTPFKGCIQGGLQEGKTITVKGRVLPGAARFHVNLQCGSKQQADVALHFNPRFDRLPGYVVLNTYHQGSWGTEERKYEAPAPRGSSFILNIMVNRDSYSIVVNGMHFQEYKHRLPVSSVDTIYVEGGVELHSIEFQNPTVSLSWPPPAYTPGPAYVVPYKCVLPGGMYHGRSITVQGVVSLGADRFAINLRFNHGIAFHFNPRFKEGTVVCNTQLKEKWGPEERSSGPPFGIGQPFTVIITCDISSYRVSVNGIQMFTYQHRYTALSEIDILEVTGDVSLTNVVV
ncbi:Galectin-9-like [Scleropages formosus]|uniref:Galectin n=1 Tax=Scleropages formosus TaxID=113540 RepID=A0A0P7UKI5_SCLFO|nr:Galectin-9-like [Scleropages formosus]